MTDQWRQYFLPVPVMGGTDFLNPEYPTFTWGTKEWAEHVLSDYKYACDHPSAMSFLRDNLPRTVFVYAQSMRMAIDFGRSVHRTTSFVNRVDHLRGLRDATVVFLGEVQSHPDYREISQLVSAWGLDRWDIKEWR